MTVEKARASPMLWWQCALAPGCHAGPVTARSKLKLQSSFNPRSRTGCRLAIMTHHDEVIFHELTTTIAFLPMLGSTYCEQQEQGQWLGALLMPPSNSNRNKTTSRSHISRTLVIRRGTEDRHPSSRANKVSSTETRNDAFQIIIASIATTVTRCIFVLLRASLLYSIQINPTRPKR